MFTCLSKIHVGSGKTVVLELGNILVKIGFDKVPRTFRIGVKGWVMFRELSLVAWSNFFLFSRIFSSRRNFLNKFQSLAFCRLYYTKVSFWMKFRLTMLWFDILVGKGNKMIIIKLFVSISPKIMSHQSWKRGFGQYSSKYCTASPRAAYNFSFLVTGELVDINPNNTLTRELYPIYKQRTCKTTSRVRYLFLLDTMQ